MLYRIRNHMRVATMQSQTISSSGRRSQHDSTGPSSVARSKSST